MWLDKALTATSKWGPGALRMARAGLKNDAVMGLGGGGVGFFTSDSPLLSVGRVKDTLLGAAIGSSRLPGQKWATSGLTRGLAGIPGVTPRIAANIAQIGVPVASLGLSGAGPSSPVGQVSRAAKVTTANVLGTGVGAINKQGNIISMSDLPKGFSPQLERMFQGPEGNWWYNLDPGGLPAGQRLGRQLGAITDASVLNTLGNALYGQTERVAKSELARQAAAYQLKANIDMARDMALNSQAAGLNIAQNAGQSMGDAMSNRSMFRYI